VSFFPATLPGGHNSTAYHEVYDGLVSSTSCLSTLGSGASLSCLRSLPFYDLSNLMSGSWVSFVVDQDSNCHGVEGVKQ